MKSKTFRRFIAIFTLILSLSLVGQLVQADGGQIGDANDAGFLWVGQYYNNTTFTGLPVFSRIEYDVNYDWGTGSPSTGFPSDNYSVRWTGTVNLNAGIHRFWVRADDHVRVSVDGRVVIDTFTNYMVDQLISGDISLSAGQHVIVIEYREYVGPAFIYFDYANLSFGETGPDFGNIVQPVPTGQWLARYYPNPNVSGTPVAILGGQEPRGNWGNAAPLASLPDDEWSARWEATLMFNNDSYLFSAQADDGIRVYLDGRLIIDEWHTATARTYSTVETLTAGLHTMVVEYFESGGTASLNFNYELSQTIPSNVSNTDTTNYLGIATIDTPRLNVRDAPNPFTGQVLTKVSQGESYRVLEFNATETWVKIRTNDHIGWVNAGYVNFSPLSSSSLNSAQYTVTTGPFTVNIRTGPGTQYNDIGNFENGDTAQVIGRNAESTWWQINYDGIVGWVSARYAKIESWAVMNNIRVTG